jgi:hypothetical protein
MRFLSHEDVATLAAAIDVRHRAFVLVAATRVCEQES